jgi:hypothetical protein
LVVDEILKVLYAPKVAFQKVTSNPKYLGALIVLLLFVGVNIAYEYAQVSKVNLEVTSPTIDQMGAYLNATLWVSTPNVAISNNTNAAFNYTVFEAGVGYYPNLFGTGSLQLEANDSSALIAALINTTNVDCGDNGFQNLTMVIKQSSPQGVPQNVTLTLYSLGNDASFYSKDITSLLSNASTVGEWNNITIPVGKNAPGWTESGSPSWSNITSLAIAFSYPSSSTITINIGALFFGGHYETLTQLNFVMFLANFLQIYSLKFIFTWFLLTGLVYLFFRGMKSTVVWKPLFIAVAFALFVMVIRGLVYLIATLTMPTSYYSFDMLPGLSLNVDGTIFYPTWAAGTLFAQSQANVAALAAANSTYSAIVTVMFVVSYVWLGALTTIIIGTLKPEFSAFKRGAITAAAIGVTILVLYLLAVGA